MKLKIIQNLHSVHLILSTTIYILKCWSTITSTMFLEHEQHPPEALVLFRVYLDPLSDSETAEKENPLWGTGQVLGCHWTTG